MEKILNTHREFDSLNQQLKNYFGISITQAVSIHLISQHNGPIAIGKFSSLLSKSGGACTAMTDLLEKKGLVERTHSKEDRRSVLLSLTEDGETLVRRLEGMQLPVAG